MMYNIQGEFFYRRTVMKIALDAMGGDKAPFETIKGAMKALEEIESLHLVLVGKKEIIEEELKKYKYDSTNRDS